MKASDPTGWTRIWQTIAREAAYQVITAGTEPRRWYRRAYLPSMTMKAAQILWAEAQTMQAFADEAKALPPQDRLGQEPRIAKLLAFPGPMERQQRARLKASKLQAT